MTKRAWAVVFLGALIGAIGCSADDDAGAPSTEAIAEHAAQLPDEIARPASEGNGLVAPQPAAPLPEGYVEEEFFVAGTATSFDAVDTPEDGRWVAAPAGAAGYRTRVIVRRPADAEDFSGTVLLEWFNVSALEASPDWAYLSEEIGRSGHAYIGVSAQQQGVEGGDTILQVELDDDAAAEVDPDADTTGNGLKHVDPERYGTLEHPGDAYSFDIFTQVGRAAHELPDKLLGGLEPEQVLGLGESQSAAFLSTLINAVHPLDPVFDGFFVHSRGATTAPLDGDYRSRRSNDEQDLSERAVEIRDDLDVPTLIFITETDLTLLGYAYARQSDSDRVRTWEVAGTAHADAQMIRSLLGGPRDPGVGSLLGCDHPINTGAHHEVAQAALRHLDSWARGGTAPPVGPRILLIAEDEVEIARDDEGNARGGIRTPLVDVPIATLTGDPPGDGSLEELSAQGGICMLLGQTIPFDQATLRELHSSADDYVAAFQAATQRAVNTGFLLPEDAEELLEEAEQNRALFG